MYTYSINNNNTVRVSIARISREIKINSSSVYFSSYISKTQLKILEEARKKFESSRLLSYQSSSYQDLTK